MGVNLPSPDAVPGSYVQDGGLRSHRYCHDFDVWSQCALILRRSGTCWHHTHASWPPIRSAVSTCIVSPCSRSLVLGALIALWFPPVQAFSALNQAEDELLLLWSSVEKDKDAVRQRQLQLRASRQDHLRGSPAAASGYSAAAAAAPPGVVSAPDQHRVQHQSQQQQPANGLHAAEGHQQRQQQQHYTTGSCDARRSQTETSVAGQAAAAAPGPGVQAVAVAAAAPDSCVQAVAAAGDGGPHETEDIYSRATSRRTTFASIDGELDDEEIRRSWLQPGSSRGTMGTLREESDPSQEYLLPSGRARKPRVQEQGFGTGVGGGDGSSGEVDGGVAGQWAAAKASLGAWWQQQQQWLEGPGWAGESSTAAAGEGSASAVGGRGSAAAVGVDGEGVVTGRGSPTGEVEPGLEKTFWHTLCAMLRDMYAVVKGPERKAFAIAAVLAVFDQATASTAVINYAPEVLSSQLGITSERNAILYPAVIAVTKCIGVAIALALVDDLGRRPLLIGGGVGCGVALFGAAGAMGSGSVVGFLAALCLFIFSFSLSWAGLYWVVVAEVFSMTAKSPASSAATSLLFLTGSVVNLLFLTMVGGLGSWAFVVFGVIAISSAWYVFKAVPETKGKTLVEIQALLQGLGARDEESKQLTGFRDVVSNGKAAWERVLGWLGHMLGRKERGGDHDVELMGLVVGRSYGVKQGIGMGRPATAEGAHGPADNGLHGTSHLHHQQQQVEEEELQHPATGGKGGGEGTVGVSTGSSGSRMDGIHPAESSAALIVAQEEVNVPHHGGGGGDLAVDGLQGNVAYYQQQAWQRQQAVAAAAAATGLGLGGGGLMLPLGQEVRPQHPLGGGGGGHNATR